jgi:hypothetical protein
MTANQRTVEIGPKAKSNAKNTFTVINLNALQQAMNDLDNSDFKLWMFYEQNALGFKVPSGPAYVAMWGLSRSSYYRAFNTLVEKGYLVKISEGYYKFYETPQPECIVEISQKQDTEFIM